MPYSTSNPPVLLAGTFNNAGPKLWHYRSTDADTAVRVTGYITNARDLGMAAGDLVVSLKTDASPLSCQIHIVTAINTNGSADLSNGLAITATNSD